MLSKNVKLIEICVISSFSIRKKFPPRRETSELRVSTEEGMSCGLLSDWEHLAL